jgi:hypothetical protein
MLNSLDFIDINPLNYFPIFNEIFKKPLKAFPETFLHETNSRGRFHKEYYTSKYGFLKGILLAKTISFTISMPLAYST